MVAKQRLESRGPHIAELHHFPYIMGQIVPSASVIV